MVLYYVGIDYYCQNLKFFPPPPNGVPLYLSNRFLVRLKEHSSNGKRGGGGGFYLSVHISQSIHPRKINLVLNDREQKSYLESTLILAILSKFFS